MVKTSNCATNKILEYDCLLTALIYGLIGCFRCKRSHLTCPITNTCNRTVKQQIKIKHFVPLAQNFNYLAYPSRSKSRKMSYVSSFTGADSKQTWSKFTASKTLIWYISYNFVHCVHYFYKAVDYILIRSVYALISPFNARVSRILLLTQLIANRTSCRTIRG